MPYAAVSDMIGMFGETELVRATTPEDQPADGIVVSRVDTSLAAASGLIDTYLRRRYQTPITPSTPELVRACCILTRYDLAFGGQNSPTEQMRLARREIVEWLSGIQDGRVTLDGAVQSNLGSSYARVTDRQRVMSCFGRRGF